MKVTIWDMDYYYAKSKRNKFNPDAMKISSYHKQCGDIVTFVLTEDDIRRPFDLYYIIRENKTTPNPPADLFLENRVRWWGKANRLRINWRMSDVMLACRPDYLLYPEKNTTLERAEQIRLLGNNGEPLPLTQDYTNAFTRKRVLVVDDALWVTSPENIIKALKTLENVKNVSFLKPIWIQKLISDKDVRDEFFKLNLTAGANLVWLPIPIDYAEAAEEILLEARKRWPQVKINPLIIHVGFSDHWNDREAAIRDWNNLTQLIVSGKRKKITYQVYYEHRMSTPYFMLFETARNWMRDKPTMSWLKYITQEYGGMSCKWNKPETWTPVFRDLLRQTYQNKDLLVTEWGDRKLSDNDLPWEVWNNAFPLGI